MPLMMLSSSPAIILSLPACSGTSSAVIDKQYQDQCGKGKLHSGNILTGQDAIVTVDDAKEGAMTHHEESMNNTSDNTTTSENGETSEQQDLAGGIPNSAAGTSTVGVDDATGSSSSTPGSGGTTGMHGTKGVGTSGGGGEPAVGDSLTSELDRSAEIDMTDI